MNDEREEPVGIPPNAIRPESVWADGTVRRWWVDDGDGPKVVGALSVVSAPCREDEAYGAGMMAAAHDAHSQLADVAGHMKVYGYDAKTLRVLTEHIFGGAKIPMPVSAPEEEREGRITRLTPCSYYPNYKAAREPTCGCAPCWEKWVERLKEYKWMYEDLCK